MMKKILIFGRNGQVATDLIALNKDADVIGSQDIDFSKTKEFKDFVDRLPAYDFVINASAYNLVDKAEEDPVAALKLNRDAVKIMAEFCKKNNSLLIHFSTNYVFDGKNPKANKEDDVDFIKPLGEYAKSKLAGEKVVIDSGCKYLIFRVATVFRENKGNFVTKMLELFTKHEQLKIVNDQVSNPCYSYDLAEAVTKIINGEIDEENLNQIYHLCNEGEVSFFELCKFIYEQVKGDVKFNVITKSISAIPSSDYPTPASRPLNGALATDKFSKNFNITLPNWQDGVKRAIKNQNNAVI